MNLNRWSYFMNIAVCDDSLIDRKVILDHLIAYLTEKSIEYNICEFEFGDRLLYEVEDGVCFDLIFLDIYMDNMLGIDVARRLREFGCKSNIVFLTATPEFAIESYDVMASGYLLKPHSYQKLCSIMDRMISDAEINVYTIKHRQSTIRIPISKITFIESSNSKCIIHSFNQTEYTVYKRLDDIEKELPQPMFLRCHRSYIVNMSYIAKADKYFELTTGDIVLIRQKSLREIKQKFEDYYATRG